MDIITKEESMNKIIGYIIAAAGVVVIALTMLNILAIPGLKTPYLIIAGVALVIVGITLTFSSGSSSRKVNQAEEEVPIYAGEGKKRKIVGYQRGK